MLKKCVTCGKLFEGTGTSSHCPGPHYKQCVVCGKEFEWDYKNPKQCCSTECMKLLRKQSIAAKTKKCEICGKEFHPRSNIQRYCDDPHFRPCPICGKPVQITQVYEEAKCCSQECTNELRKRTCLSRYGVSIASQNVEVRAKLHERAVSPDVIAKRRDTSIKHWGVDNPAKSAQIKQKISNTVCSTECQHQMRSTTLQRYGVEYAMQSPEGLRRYSETIQAKYGVPYFCMTDECKQAQGDIVSSLNRAFGRRLSAVGLPYEFEQRIEDMSYDIRIKGTNTLIEIDPTYTHNIIGNHWGGGVDKNYHRDKTRLAAEHGYRCIHIFDWDDINKVLVMLKPKQTVYARKCEIHEIDAKSASEFEVLHHLQGSVQQQTVCIGLFHDKELIQVMTFGTPRYNKKFEWELLRLCSATGYAVVGGAEKLWKYFIRTKHPKSIISYCDLSKFDGSVYSRIGMTLDGVVPPNKIWSKGEKMITNNLLLQRGYDQLFGTSFGKGTSNEELMLNDGWLPVYDCGQARYVWHS